MLQVTLHQLRLFAALARRLNMTRAAEEMHVTPSAFSIQIKQLSQGLGLPLHEQAGKKLFLTEAGRAVAAASRDMLERLDLLGMELMEMQGLERGRLRLAMITTAKYFATRLIGDFCRTHPEVEFALEVVNREQILERMRHHPHPALRATFSRKREKGLPLQETQKMRITQGCFSFLPDLTDEARTVHPARAGIGDPPGDRALFRRAQDPPGDAHDARLDPALGPLRELDVEGFPLPRQWYVVYLRDKKLSPLARAFLALLKESRR